MTEPPAVSVILPTYNRANVLDRAIESVLDQTYSDFELLVVDDDSSDNTVELINSFCDPRITLIEHDENRGPAAARNTGLQEATADYIAFQDSDDQWEPEKLERQMAVFDDTSPSVGVVYCTLLKIHDNDTWRVPGKQVSVTEGDIHRALWVQNFVSPQVVVARRACFEEVGGFDARFPPLEDWEMWLRISREFEFRHVDEPLVNAHTSSDSISMDHETVAESRNAIVRKHWDTFDDEARARHLFWSGHGLVKAGQTHRGRENLLSATTTNPRPLYLVSFLLSLLGSGGYRRLYTLFKSYLSPVFSVDP
jgi:glycosyltransferase involved in cell wall biosynthesis